MKKLPNIKYDIEITTIDDQFIAIATLQHRSGHKIIKDTFSAKSLKKLAALQHKVLSVMLSELTGIG